MKKFLGAIVALMGISLIGWIAYCFLTGQPEAKEYNPLVPIGISCAFIYVGAKWMGLIGDQKSED